jgi:hypothetical protein
MVIEGEVAATRTIFYHIYIYLYYVCFCILICITEACIYLKDRFVAVGAPVLAHDTTVVPGMNVRQFALCIVVS